MHYSIIYIYIHINKKNAYLPASNNEESIAIENRLDVTDFIVVLGAFNFRFLREIEFICIMINRIYLIKDVYVKRVSASDTPSLKCFPLN